MEKAIWIKTYKPELEGITDEEISHLYDVLLDSNILGLPHPYYINNGELCLSSIYKDQLSQLINNNIPFTHLYGEYDGSMYLVLDYSKKTAT